MVVEKNGVDHNKKTNLKSQKKNKHIYQSTPLMPLLQTIKTLGVSLLFFKNQLSGVKE